MHFVSGSPLISLIFLANSRSTVFVDMVIGIAFLSAECGKLAVEQFSEQNNTFYLIIKVSFVFPNAGEKTIIKMTG